MLSKNGGKLLWCSFDSLSWYIVTLCNNDNLSNMLSTYSTLAACNLANMHRNRRLTPTSAAHSAGLRTYEYGTVQIVPLLV